MQGPVHATCAWDPDGAGPQPELVVLGGSFQRAGEVAASNIAAHDLSSHGFRSFDVGLNGIVRALTVLPNGDLLATGEFATISGQPARSCARWNGASWQTFVSSPDIALQTATLLQGGDVLLSTTFPWSGNAPSSIFARAVGACPATATAFAQPCAGPVGPLVASAESLPWVGSTCATRAVGFAPTAIGFVATGLTSPNTPLLSFHPAGVPGCDLLSSTEAVQLVLPTAGSAPYRFALPNSSAFAGQLLYQQFVELDFDASGTLTSLSGSNGLELVVGVF